MAAKCNPALLQMEEGQAEAQESYVYSSPTVVRWTLLLVV